MSRYSEEWLIDFVSYTCSFQLPVQTKKSTVKWKCRFNDIVLVPQNVHRNSLTASSQQMHFANIKETDTTLSTLFHWTSWELGKCIYAYIRIYNFKIEIRIHWLNIWHAMCNNTFHPWGDNITATLPYWLVFYLAYHNVKLDLLHKTNYYTYRKGCSL